MHQSGKKLVFALACLAVLAGVTSWTYRYAATHQATEFWGSAAAPLIAQPSEVEFCELHLAVAQEPPDDLPDARLQLGRSYTLGEPKPLTKARGMVHLRNSLMSDRSYDWASIPDPAATNWQWYLRFFVDDRQAGVVLSADFATIGRVDEAGNVAALSCRPLSGSLLQYFGEGKPPAASTDQ